MNILGQKEVISNTIPVSQSTVSVTFVESYTIAPKVIITETSNPIEYENLTTTGVDINAINSKVDTTPSTTGRTFKLSIC